MLAIVLSGLIGLSNLINPPHYYVEVAIFHGDPLGSKQEGTIELLSRPALSLRNRQQGITTCDLADGESIIRLAMTPRYASFNQVTLELNARVRLDSGAVQQVEVTKLFTSATPNRIRIGSESDTKQTWMEVMVIRYDSNKPTKLALDTPKPLTSR